MTDPQTFDTPQAPDTLRGALGHEHWWLDLPGVYLPGILLPIFALRMARDGRDTSV